VLWATSLLAVLAAGFGQNGHSEAVLARNALESTKARLLADAGAHAALFDLLRADAAGEPLTIAEQHFALGDGEVRLVISDEDGKIDLNAVPADLLARLLAGLGVDPPAAARLADRIVEHRPYHRVEGLTDVSGMGEDLVTKLRPLVTVYSGLETVAPEAASAPVLSALPGSNADLAAELREQGLDSKALVALPDDMRAGIEDHLLSSRALVFGIETLGRSAGAAIYVRRAVVALEPSDRDRPFTIYGWDQGDPAGFAFAVAAHDTPP